ncbi:aspartate/glutamate racemase family protein [Haloarchaeobius iranensis]|uniref:Aspartate racemase n=1 Tax=Haloarchaeobius iranensis TaxID=996166 RepID=A0A1G9SCJ3_9EURY|nr:amino acid racemase [Haloarchaeobius iranensis]SDM33216.1 aspartate racemase [Haloarchaeobius iranensis]
MDTAHDGTLATVGILGGMSSESTVEYYRGVDAGINEARGGHAAGQVLVRSVNFADIEGFIADERWDAAGDYLAAAAEDLEAGGANFVVMATNTMHRVAPAIEDALSVPFVHIVDPTAGAIADAGLETVGVLGTRPVMEGEFYADRFADHGIDVIVPEAGRRQQIHDIIFDELTKGIVTEESREGYVAAIEELVDAGAEGVVLGCTEIEMLVAQADVPGTPLFDTTALHVADAVDRCLGVAASQ